jgi:hypothetical protein
MTKGRAALPGTAVAEQESPERRQMKRRSLHYAPPDFLWRPVALRICMRLSLRRAAHVDVVSSAK